MQQPADSTGAKPPTPHAPSRDDPEALAKHAITLLEKRLENEFGLRAVMGAELEFSVLPHYPQEGYGVSGEAVKGGSHTSSQSRLRHKQDPWFPESSRVTYSYHEVQMDASWDALEVVLTHRPTNAEGKPVAHDALILARSIEALRNQLHHTPPGYKPGARGKTPARESVHGWQEFRKTALAALSTEPLVKGTFATNGLHLNMSLIDAQTHDNVLSQTHADHAGLVDSLSTHIGQMFHENTYLIASGKASVMRWQVRTSTPSMRQFSNHVRCKHMADYIENVIPDASANPNYAVLLQLAGTVQALSHHGFNHRESSPHLRSEQTPVTQHTREWSNTSYLTLKDDFNNAHTLRDVLNVCEPELGNRFMTAIERCPPGKEASSLRVKPDEAVSR